MRRDDRLPPRHRGSVHRGRPRRGVVAGRGRRGIRASDRAGERGPRVGARLGGRGAGHRHAARADRSKRPATLDGPVHRVERRRHAARRAVARARVAVNQPRSIVLGDNVCYALTLDDGGVLLVDAGPDFVDEALGPTWDQAVEQARAHGFSPRDVRFVVVTHGHLDHAGLAARWAAEGARIVVGQADRAALAAGRASNEAQRALRLVELRRHGCPEAIIEHLATLRGTRALRWEPCPPDALLPADEVGPFHLEGGGALRLLAAPGHTPGNLVGWVEERGDLYSGDTVLPTTIPTPGLHFPAAIEAHATDSFAPPVAPALGPSAGRLEGGGTTPAAPRWPSLPPFLRSVEALARLPVGRVLPGHGEVVDDPARLFGRFAVHHERRAARIRAALRASSGVTAYEVVRALFPRLPEARVGQAMTEVIGHFDVLEEAGAVEVTEVPAAAEAAEGSIAVRRYRLRDGGEPSAG
ncbi:MAG: MBL fold metallo-hydrolase [Dehalococcoidia bacterium]|nr:MBL fold metallo-hydrolase [Dehalococcoidia bacterium]